MEGGEGRGFPGCVCFILYAFLLAKKANSAGQLE